MVISERGGGKGQVDIIVNMGRLSSSVRVCKIMKREG